MDDVLTKIDLIAAFSAECFAMDKRLIEFAHAEYAAGYGILVNLLDRTATKTPDTAWWTEDNYARYLNQWHSLERNLEDNEYQVHLDEAQAQLKSVDGHFEQFDRIQHEITTANPRDASHYKWLPHEVGVGNSEYGQELRATDGWKSIAMTCTLIQSVRPTILWVNNPQQPNLKESFGFAVLLRSTDQTALAPKIRAAYSSGLISALN